MISTAKLGYTPAITGNAIDAAVKAKSQTPPAAYQGWFVWDAMLQLLYTDFSTVLAAKLFAFLLNTQVQFPPGIMALVVIAAMIPPVLAPLATATAQLIDGQIKAQCSAPTNQAPVIAMLGMKIWTEVCTAIGLDLMNTIPIAVCGMLSAAIVQHPPGVAAPPVVSTLAPGVAMPTAPFVPSALMGLMQPFLNKGALTAIGTQIDSKIKGENSAPGDGTAATIIPQGAKIWQAFLDIFCKHVDMALETSIMMFVTTPGMNWTSMPGLPGPPFTPAPSVSGTIPGKNM